MESSSSADDYAEASSSKAPKVATKRMSRRRMTGTTRRSENTAPNSGEIEMIHEETGWLGKVRELEEHCFVLLYLILTHRTTITSSKPASLFSMWLDFWFTLMLCFSPSISWYAPMEGFQSVADAFLPSSRTMSPNTQTLLFYFIVALIVVSLLVFVYSVRIVQDRDVPHTNVVLFLRLSFYVLYEIGYQPFLSIVMSPMGCHREDSQQTTCENSTHIAKAAISAVVTLFYAAASLTYALVVFDALPEKGSFLSRPLGRQKFMIILFRTIFITMHILVDVGYVKSSILFVCNTASLVVWIRYPMFHQTLANALKVASIGVVSWTSLFSVVYATRFNRDQYGPLVVYAILLPVSAAAPYWLVVRRLRRLDEKYSSIVNNKHGKDIFGFWYLVELATRYSLSEGEWDESKFRAIKKIYACGINEFKKEPYIRIQYSLFLLAYDESADISELQLHVYSVLGLKHESIDRRFLVAYLRRAWQQELENRGMGTSNDGLQLSDHLYFRRQTIIARHFQEEAKKTLYYFWRTILQHGSDHVIETKAEEFEDCEKISLSAYDNLLRRFPTHVTLLRNYGQFWLEIYRNQSISSEYFSIADEIEQTQSQKRTNAAIRAYRTINKSHDTKEMNEHGEVDNVEIARSENTVSTKERDRLRVLKNRIMTTNIKERERESDSVKHFMRLMLVLQLTLFAIPLASYVLFDKIAIDLTENSENMKKLHSQINKFETFSYIVRSQILNNPQETRQDICSYNQTCIYDTRNRTIQIIDRFQDAHTKLFRNILSSYKNVKKFWLDTPMNATVYLHAKNTSTQQQMSFLDAVNFYAENAKHALSGDIVRDYESDRNFRFVVDNSQSIILPSLIRLSELYGEEERSFHLLFKLLLLFLLGFLVLFLVVIGGLWTPSYEKVREEVSSLNKLKMLPRDAIVEMCKLFRFKVDNDTDEDVDNFQVTKSFSKNDRQIKNKRKFVFMVLLVCGMAGCIVMWIFELNKAVNMTMLSLKSSERIAYAGSVFYKLRDLFIVDKVTESSLADVYATREIMLRIHRENLKQVVDDKDHEVTLWEDCKVGDGFSLVQETSSLVFQVGQTAYQASLMNADQRLEYVNKYFSYDGYKSKKLDCMLNISERYQKETTTLHHVAVEDGNVFFWLVWPLFMFFFAYKLPKEFKEKVKSATSRSTRIIKMIPTTIIDKAPTLKDHFIEHNILRISDFEDLHDFDDFPDLLQEKGTDPSVSPAHKQQHIVGQSLPKFDEVEEEEVNENNLDENQKDTQMSKPKSSHTKKRPVSIRQRKAKSDSVLHVSNKEKINSDEIGDSDANSSTNAKAEANLDPFYIPDTLELPERPSGPPPGSQKKDLIIPFSAYHLDSSPSAHSPLQLPLHSSRLILNSENSFKPEGIISPVDNAAGVSPNHERKQGGNQAPFHPDSARLSLRSVSVESIGENHEHKEKDTDISDSNKEIGES